jgi:uncharacterized membrane protein
MEMSLKVNSQLRRIQSIDLLRGAVMIIMAIDHVRVYSGIPAGGPTAGIFFTRWITHFCAPAFVFFAGTSAFLYFQKTNSKSDVARFLITRGLLLVLLELTVIRFFWMFNLDYSNFAFTGVIWALGWCMVILAAFVRLQPITISIIGLFIIFAQQLFHYVPGIFPASLQESIAKVWTVFYPPLLEAKTGTSILSGISGLPRILGISIFYVLIPWVGVMMAGYGFGQLIISKSIDVKKICLRIGLSTIALFLMAGSLIILIVPAVEGDLPFLFKLLGQQKYPPTQLYLLMTIGPLIVLTPWAEKAKGWVANAVILIGRVPMFYYLLHILLIHLSAFVVNLILSGSVHQEWYVTAPFVGIPQEQHWSLPVLYLVWAIDVVILYYACRWYAGYKSNHPEKIWLKYL